jgi:hypothetical protein
MDRTDWLIAIVLGVVVGMSLVGAYASLHKHHRLLLASVETQ